MLDIKLIREDPEPFRVALARRELADSVDELLAADERRRALTQRVDELRAAQNRASKAIGGAQGDEKQALIAEVSSVSAELKEAEPLLRRGRCGAAGPARATPNLPHEARPMASRTRTRSRSGATTRHRRSSTSRSATMPRSGRLGVLDTERGARTSGSRFVYLWATSCSCSSP